MPKTQEDPGSTRGSTKQEDRGSLGQSFPMYLMFGMLAAMGSMFALLHYGGRGINTSLHAAEITMGLCTLFAVLMNIRRPFRRLVKSLLTCLFTGGMISGMFVFIGCTLLTSWWGDAPVLAKFAQDDFAQVDTAGKGIVTSEQLEKILNEQAKFSTSLADLKEAEKVIDATTASDSAKRAAKEALVPAEKELQARLLPADQVARMFTVKNDIATAGREIMPQAGNNPAVYGVTVDDLTHYQDKLQSEFPDYFWLMRTVHYKI